MEGADEFITSVWLFSQKEQSLPGWKPTALTKSTVTAQM